MMYLLGGVYIHAMKFFILINEIDIFFFENLFINIIHNTFMICKNNKISDD